MGTRVRDTDTQHRLPQLGLALPNDKEELHLKEELLSVLLHDMRSPLGAITALTNLISASTERGENADSRQLQLLQDAVTRAQRVLDDAFEIQAILRGSSTFNSTVIDLETIIRCTADKARHAPYFYGADLTLDFQHGKPEGRVRVDVEKMETVLLGLMEQLLLQADETPALRITTCDDGHFLRIRIDASSCQHQPAARFSAKPGLRGRLGTRRLGESRYSMQICRLVLEQMGAHLDTVGHPPKAVTIRLPRTSE